MQWDGLLAFFGTIFILWVIPEVVNFCRGEKTDDKDN